MKLYQQIQSENVSNMFLFGSILMASIDYVGLLDYLLKAILGGGVWFIFKVCQDYFTPFIKRNADNKIKAQQEKEEREKEKEKAKMN